MFQSCWPCYDQPVTAVTFLWTQNCREIGGKSGWHNLKDWIVWISEIRNKDDFWDVQLIINCGLIIKLLAAYLGITETQELDAASCQERWMFWSRKDGQLVSTPAPPELQSRAVSWCQGSVWSGPGWTQRVSCHSRSAQSATPEPPPSPDTELPDTLCSAHLAHVITICC